LNNWHERLNVLWRNIGSPNVALWTQVIRRRAGIAASREEIAGRRAADGWFAAALLAKYRRRLADETLMLNEVYLAVVHRPTSGLATGLASKILSRTQRDGSRLAVADALDTCEKLGQTLAASLARYEPELLGIYRSGQVWCSSLLEYLGLLVNGEWQRVPLPSGPINQALATTRLFFGTEALEYRLPTATRVGAVLGIKEYPTPSVVGMYNRLLSAPFSFVLTQSFAFLTKATGQSLLQRQFNRMANAGDFAVSQAAELNEALDALTSNEFIMGDHHFSLQVLAEIADESAPASVRLKPLNDRVALARSYLADTGMMVAREDLALEAAFWAQLPGNFPVRPRKAPITSRNFAAMVSQLPGGPGHRESLGRRVECFRHQRALALLFLAARQRSHGSRRRQPQGHRPYAHLRAHRFGQDRLHRLPDRAAGSSGCNPSHLRQGSRTRAPGTGAGRRIPAVEKRGRDRVQPAAVADNSGECGVSQSLAAHLERRAVAASRPGARDGRS
jgi:type IV secretion system protein VirB4